MTAWRISGLVSVLACCAVAASAAGRPDRPSASGTTNGPHAPGVARPVGPTSTAAGASFGARATTIIGSAWTANNTPIPRARLRLRNVITGRLEGAVTANESGQFTFENVEGGSYLVELVNDVGHIQVVGHMFTIAPGETVATFVRLGTRVPWFTEFFGNSVSAVSSTAASEGITALAPVARPVSANR
jgi:hypothetical protein